MNSSVNIDATHYAGSMFESTVNPRTINPNALKQPIIGGKINRRKINKISKQYKMKGNKKTISKNVKRIKSKIRSRCVSRKNISRTNRKTSKNKRSKNKRCNTKRCKTHKHKNRKHMKGGLGPNYPSGYSQFENNHPVSNTYSTGGPLSPSFSALANPVPYFDVKNNAIDNLNHNAANSSGHNVGSGFASRGWW